MKKFIAFILLIAVTVSCETDVKFADPGLQGRKDNIKWRADLASATITGSTLVITAYRGLESVTLSMPAPASDINELNAKTYVFSADEETNDDIAASYTFEDDDITLEYVTGFDAEGEVLGNAVFVLNKFDFAKRRVSGTFRFNAKYQGDSEIVPENVNFQEGAFFNVPVQ